jgi:WD repeat-containing protein 35
MSKKLELMESKAGGGGDGFDSSDDEHAESPTGLTTNQNRLLYLISLYTHPAQTADEQEGWLRKTSLHILIYESIRAKALDYDYAPSSVMIGNRRVFINVSQEGRSDVDYLREEELLNGLKLQSREFHPVTCYQVSEKGLELIAKLGRKDRAAIEEVCYAPASKDLLHSRWEDEEAKFILECEKSERDGRTVRENEYSRPSDVGYIEDVSYVSSAYVPQCLRRKGGRPTMSNAHKASLCRKSSNIRDELDEVLNLSSVSIVVAEYIPAGANQIVQMNDNLGSMDRVQGGFFTQVVDSDSKSSQLEVAPGLTTVDVLDYSPTEHVNFEADIHYPEESDIIQVETFGVSMNASGCNFYGMQIEAVMDRIKDNISVDHLSRLLVDVQQDSSRIVDSVISTYARKMIDTIFMGDRKNRGKVNLIIANEITPHLTAEEYMDKGEYENELKQILGDTRAAFDISEHDTLIFGEFGLLVAGANARHHEPILCAYLALCALDRFTKTYYVRLQTLLSEMAMLSSAIDCADKDPNTIVKSNRALTKHARELIMLEEILTFMNEAVTGMEIPPEPPEQAGRTLYERLELHAYKGQVHNRIEDMHKNLAGARFELGLLEGMAQRLKDDKTWRLQESIHSTNLQIADMQAQHAKNGNSLIVLKYIMAALFAIEAVDRIVGDYSIVNTVWARTFAEYTFQTAGNLWILAELAAWLITAAIVWAFANSFDHEERGKIRFKIQVNKMVKFEALKIFLRKQDNARRKVCGCFVVGGSYHVEERYDSLNNHMVRRKWTTTVPKAWGGMCPTITVLYDEDSKVMMKDIEGQDQEVVYLHEFHIEYNKNKASQKFKFNANELHERLVSLLQNDQVWLEDDFEEYQLLMRGEDNAFYNDGGVITRDKVDLAIKGTMQSKKKLSIAQAVKAEEKKIA